MVAERQKEEAPCGQDGQSEQAVFQLEFPRARTKTTSAIPAELSV
jgi:hypothetical protein